MKPSLSTLFALAVLVATLGAKPTRVGAGPAVPPAVPPAVHKAEAWHADPIWYDGLAEIAVYRARRTIYGEPREYVATAYTNKQRQDPKTTVKSTTDDGLLVFKHHWSERVPTENYDYDFSTACFVAHDTLAPYKLAVGTQEDCGASFKQAVVEGRNLAWLESVYHPGGGLRQGSLRLRDGLQFEDALTLTLRDFPFDAPRTLELALVPSQKSPNRAPFEPVAATVTYIGKEELALPIGELTAHRLELAIEGAARATYWFAAEGSPPRLHLLLRYEGPQGVVYELEQHERRAYWERG